MRTTSSVTHTCFFLNFFWVLFTFYFVYNLPPELLELRKSPFLLWQKKKKGKWGEENPPTCIQKTDFSNTSQAKDSRNSLKPTISVSVSREHFRTKNSNGLLFPYLKRTEKDILVCVRGRTCEYNWLLLDIKHTVFLHSLSRTQTQTHSTEPEGRPGSEARLFQVGAVFLRLGSKMRGGRG